MRPPTRALPRRWDLGVFFAGLTDPRIEADLAEAGALGLALREQCRGRIADLTPAEARAAIESFQRQLGLLLGVMDFAELLTFQDTEDEAPRALLAHARAVAARAQADTAFVVLELQAASPERFAALVAAPELAPFRHYLQRLRRLAAHALDEQAERIVTLKDVSGAQAWRRLYNVLTAGLVVRVGPRELGEAEANALLVDADRGARREASEALGMAFVPHAEAIAAAFGALADDHARTLKLRGHTSPLGPQLLEDDLPAEAVEGLLAAVEARHELVRRYCRFKARALGLADFASYDVFAPFDARDERVTFPEARQIVLDAFEAFSPAYASVAAGFFDGPYLDEAPRRAKSPGAFCFWCRPGIHPFVLLNYTDRPHDVLVLAHELGHGTHYALLDRTQQLLDVRLGLINEAPSTFAEMLTFDRMLRAAEAPAARRALLATVIESAISTVFLMARAARFEQAVFARRQEGILGPQDLAELWNGLRGELYGDAVALPTWDRWGWLRYGLGINQPFYSPLYPFGMLLAFAFLQRYREEGPAFAPRYLAMLEAGVSMPVAELVAMVGLDVRDPACWRQALDFLAGLVDELEAI
ncbi:MAG: oligoendopeptidase [Cyanobacteria bacterium RYN_339]|nr:oligoendopeptidase [Cyanobacteria bacterium RYN_339]